MFNILKYLVGYQCTNGWKHVITNLLVIFGVLFHCGWRSTEIRFQLRFRRENWNKKCSFGYGYNTHFTLGFGCNYMADDRNWSEW